MSRVLARRAFLWAVVSMLASIGLWTAVRSATGLAGAPPETAVRTTQPSTDWTTRITDDIRRSEYHFSPQGDGSLSAPNRAHDLRTRLDGSELTVTSRTKG